MKIWSHTIVKNEERWIWYSLKSAVNFVEKMLVWDTGSTDNTIKIIKAFSKKYPNKVDFREVGNVSPEEFTSVRQRMLERTESNWFIVLDADEIWWDASIRKLTETINKKGSALESIVVPTVNLVGDIFHYQEGEAGRYNLAGRKGHLALRAVNTKIPGLHSQNPHGTWGWVDGRGNMIQDRDAQYIYFCDAPMMHMTHLPRGGSREFDLKTPKRSQKLKYEIGIAFPKDYYFPEAFFDKRASFIPSPWVSMDYKFRLRARFETPLKKIKRRLFAPQKAGY